MSNTDVDVIVTHRYADLDAVASLVAANKLYPDARCLRNARVSKLARRYLALHRDEFPLTPPAQVDPERVGTLISVDTRNGNQLSEYSEMLARASRKVVWDHHPASPDDIEADESHVEPVGACTTLFVEAFRENGSEVTSREATLMVLGIYADTGRLSYPGTTPRDARATAWLLQSGADLGVVNRYLRSQFSQDQRRLFTDLMYNSEVLDIEGTRVAVPSAEMEDTVDGASDVVQHLMQMGDYEAMIAAIAFDGGDYIQLIGRSRVPYVDVGAILGAFGGGGHASAAGATRKEVDLETAVSELKEALWESEIRPTRVRDLMSSPVHVVDRDTSLGDCRELLDEWEVTGAPVGEPDGPVEGIISRRDIGRAERGARLDLPVSSHMSQEPVVVPPDSSLEETLDLMTEHEVGRLPVCDGDQLVGIVTRTDVRSALYDAADSESAS